MPWIVVDVEADGPCPVIYSMVSFAAVVLTPDLDLVFEGKTAPVSSEWRQDALAICGVTREEHESYPRPEETMRQFSDWLSGLKSEGSLTFVSDNPAFDWQFINYYLYKFVGSNPFGFSARRIGDLYSGWKGDARTSNAWKTLRRTAHTHRPLDDAKGNAEALLAMAEMGLKLPSFG